MARILITRPQDDAAPLAKLLEEQGHTSLIAPLLEITDLDEPLDLTGAQALLFTSANGVRAAARATTDRHLPALCVGDATAREAKQQGFHHVTSADGDVSTLAALVKRQCNPADGILIHVAGTTIAGALAETLEASGFKVRRTVLYEARPLTTLPTSIADALRHGTLDAVMLFSPRTAMTFATLVTEAGLGDACAGIDMMCLSQAVANALENLPRRDTLVAPHPTQADLIALL